MNVLFVVSSQGAAKYNVGMMSDNGVTIFGESNATYPTNLSEY